MSTSNSISSAILYMEPLSSSPKASPVQQDDADDLVEHMEHSHPVVPQCTSVRFTSPLPFGWEERHAPGGWPYYVDSMTGTIKLTPPEGQRDNFLQSRPNTQTQLQAIVHLTPEEAYATLIDQLILIYKNPWRRSRLLQESLDPFLKELLVLDEEQEPPTPTQQDHLRDALDRALGSLLDATLRKNLDRRLERLDPSQEGMPSRQEMVHKLGLLDNIPLVVNIPATSTSNAPRSKRRYRVNTISLDAELPRLPLDTNRAWCGMCKMDFEEPRKPVSGGVEGYKGQLQHPVQPLRLLLCGHVFHKLCADVEVLYKSGMCPSCSAPIQLDLEGQGSEGMSQARGDFVAKKKNPRLQNLARRYMKEILRYRKWMGRALLVLRRRDGLNRFPLMFYIPAPKPESPMKSSSVDAGQRWEDNWVKSDLPYLPLEDHRAGCQICLMDFEEPRRRDEPRDESEWEVMRDETTPEPIRMLPCGHAFHMSCVDPWFANESTQCPYCRRDTGIMDSPHSNNDALDPDSDAASWITTDSGSD